MNLFEPLTGAENTELYRRLYQAGRAYDKLTGVLMGAQAYGRMLADYVSAWHEVNGLMGDLTEVRPPGAPSVFVPTGTGWPV